MDIKDATNSIIPFLWFDNNLESAIKFYESIFKNFKLNSIQATGEGEQRKVFGASFEMNGQRFNAINGGPTYTFTPAVSFFISCKSQEEIDYYWNKLLENGKPNKCGWLTDQFGLSWQVVPTNLGEFIRFPEGMQAMLQMEKLEIETLRIATEKYK